MTARELRDLLSKIPEDMLDNDVGFSYRVGCCGDVEEFTDVVGDIYKSISYVGLSLTFCDGVAGHETCRQSAFTKKKSKELYGESK